MSRGEADDFFARVRSENKGATHYVPAFALGDKRELLWMSDDGEPQGTAGGPILTLIESSDLTWIAVMVVRYFGGVKLGTGGLSRAYSEAAKSAIESAGIAAYEDAISFRYEIDYTFFDKIQNAVLGIGANLTDIGYAEKVTFTIMTAEESAESVQSLVETITSGTAVLLGTETSVAKCGRIEV
jgi:uncharacterized YigZ family protein